MAWMHTCGNLEEHLVADLAVLAHRTPLPLSQYKPQNPLLQFHPAITGEVAEWPNVPDSKSGVPQGTVGSNPTLSAKS